MDDKDLIKKMKRNLRKGREPEGKEQYLTWTLEGAVSTFSDTFGLNFN